VIPVLVIDTRLSHEICKRRGCNASALDGSAYCRPHDADQKYRAKISARGRRFWKKRQLELEAVR
jgi:hypothetical protein